MFGAPFFAFVGGGSGWRGRAWSAGLGAALPIVGLLAYDVVTTGQLISPAYDHLYRLETAGYAALGYHADWGIEDVRYLLQNLGVALFGTPDLLPAHLPDALGRSTRSWSARTRPRSAACSTSTARWPCRATRG